MNTAVDLLTWPEYQAERDAFEAELDVAAAAVQAALERYEAAVRRARFAPHGEARSRRAELRLANDAVLSAELAMAAIKRREPVWE